MIAVRIVDPALLGNVAPRVGDAISKIPGVVSVEDGIENTISGPAIVELPVTTVVLPPGAHAEVDPLGNIVIDVGIEQQVPLRAAAVAAGNGKDA